MIYPTNIPYLSKIGVNPSYIQFLSIFAQLSSCFPIHLPFSSFSISQLRSELLQEGPEEPRAAPLGRFHHVPHAALGGVAAPGGLSQGLDRIYSRHYMAVCQNLVPLVNPKIAGKWMFIPLKMVLIGIDPYPYMKSQGGVFIASFGFPEGCGEINQENDFSLGMALKAIRTMGINKNPSNNELMWVKQ